MFEEKIIEINDKDNYYVLRQVIFNGILYLVANELDGEDNPTDVIAVLRVENSGDDMSVFLEKDDAIVAEVLKLADKEFD